MSKIVFCSGLHRSGSTLLSAILNQNPRFEAHIPTPVAEFVGSIINFSNNRSMDRWFFDEEKMLNILRSSIENCFSSEPNKVIFDHSKEWAHRTALLRKLYPNHKMIIMVRDINYILNSFELLAQKNFFKQPAYVVPKGSCAANSTVYERCENIMDLIFPTIQIIKNIIMENSNNCLIIEYDSLTKDPENVIKSVYEHIEEPYFKHDFSNVSYNNIDFDVSVNAPNLHKVSGKVEHRDKKIVIPEEIWNSVKGMETWK